MAREYQNLFIGVGRGELVPYGSYYITGFLNEKPLARLRNEGIPFVSILTNPTTGGVTASYATLGDINVAEPGALIGFAGPRVIEQTVRETLPEGFQRSEFLLEHGAIDMIIDRRDMRDRLHRILSMLAGETLASEEPAGEAEAAVQPPPADVIEPPQADDQPHSE